MNNSKTKRGITTAVGVALALCLTGLARAGQFNLGAPPITALGPVELSNFDLTKGTSSAFRGDYVIPFWAGDLVAYEVEASGSAVVKWRARNQLSAQNWNTGDTARRIFTSRSSGNGTPFRWGDATTGLTAAQRTALLVSGSDAALGAKIVNYLRGDTANERTATDNNKLFRQRLSPFGAIIHSRPFHWVHGNDAQGDPIERVYIGANDGMLHAIDAATGRQMWAYVPSMVIGKLRAYTDPANTDYKFYVDGLHTIASVPTGTGTAKIPMLISGLGAGARGIFALDISKHSPTSDADAASMAKYEITNTTTGFTNLGHVYGAPKIVKLEDGTTVALLPNGVNSTSERASLFVINAYTGSLISEIVADNTSNANGLGGITAIDTNGNGRADRVYAGDLRGKLYRFTLPTNSAGASAAVTTIFEPATGTVRPITAAPSVIAHPRGGHMVNFGTGKAIEAADATSTDTDYLYGLWDHSSITSTARSFATPTLTDATQTSNNVTVKYRVGNSTAIDYPTQTGWRISLSPGERLVGGDTFTRTGRYVITTNNPVRTHAGYGGWMLQINALTGAAPTLPFFDLNSDGNINQTAGSADYIAVPATSPSQSPVPIGRFMGAGAWSQPVLAKVADKLDVPYFNFNPNDSFQQYSGGGISNGHFDVDVYYGTCKSFTGTDYSCSSGKHHKHEYDDTYNVVGVNMLDASFPELNLVNAIPNDATGNAKRLKFLLVNTHWSPAAVLELKYLTIPGDASSLATLESRVTNLFLSPEGFLATTAGGPALELTRAQMQRFVIKFPTDAFESKEWNSEQRPGDVRAGLIPTVTGCVQKNTGGQGSSIGPWMNGALTVQVVDSSTTSSDIEPATPTDDATTPTSGDGAGGYRLKKDLASPVFYQAKQLAQYTYFWHHPNGKCYGVSGWTKAPPQSTDGSSSGSANVGTDPTISFSFGSDGGTVVGGGTTQATIDGVQVTITYRYDATTETYVQVIKYPNRTVENVLASGTLTRQMASNRDNIRTGRLSWREVIR
jgi:Neisseria PilC beta-propeller domain